MLSFDLDFVSIRPTISPLYEFFNNNNDHRKNFSYDASLYTYWYLPLDFNIYMEASYRGKRLSNQGYNVMPQPYLGLSLSKTFWSGNAQAYVTYTGLFFPVEVINVIEQERLYQWKKDNNNMRSVGIGFSYNLRKGKEYYSERIEKFLDNDDARK